MEVANVVASIISALGNGKDLFRRMLGKKSKRRGRKPTLSEEEAWLQESLSRRPQEVQASFNQSVTRHGRKFERGDSAAHSSLAHTLLVLNSGLVNLINTVLHGDSKHDSKSSQALLQLSNTAARDTISALSQLSLRLSEISATDHVGPKQRPGMNQKETKRRVARHLDEKSTISVRGAWVRPKNKSIVSVVSSLVDIDLPKPVKRPRGTKHRRNEAQSLSPSRHDTRPSHYRETSGVKEARKVPSMLIVPSDMFIATEPHRPYSPPPPHSRSKFHPSRPRPASAATFMTTSTNIGEIQPRRLQCGVLANDEPEFVEHAARTALEPATKPKKLRRGFKFWKGHGESGSVLAN